MSNKEQLHEEILNLKKQIEGAEDKVKRIQTHVESLRLSLIAREAQLSYLESLDNQ